MNSNIVIPSLCVDASCVGNPGPMEYRGIETKSGRVIFSQKFSRATNNIGEFLALVHGLAYFKKYGISDPVYGDSVTAIAWVRNAKCNSSLAIKMADPVGEAIRRAEVWLHDNIYYDNEILKWLTSEWGEIPADYGRKQ